ncbi:hypothetical protein Ciccas_011340 [Cichlidogyrus casuarinus]|uniref:Uncharacterized protein n=1 Tax=Cichlidogyrus casuarinus TaxID=1844966 RepID=A0ABD2PWA2_9PLAT
MYQGKLCGGKHSVGSKVNVTDGRELANESSTIPTTTTAPSNSTRNIWDRFLEPPQKNPIYST